MDRWIMIGAGLLLLVACGTGAVEEATPVAEGTVTASGLRYIEVEAGAGAQPLPGDRVQVHYTGTLEDGTEFDSSRDRDPLEFVLGTGQVIRGWDEGIALMKEGGRARLVIPPELAYGPAGFGDVIPPDATLNFEVELVAVLPPAAAAAEPPPPTPGAPPTTLDPGDFMVTESGLSYAILEEGSGELAQNRQVAVVHFVGWLEDGTQFASSEGRQPITMNIGRNEVIPGWDEALLLMKAGSKLQIVVPPELGLGAEGGGPIPPDATLIFELELVELQEAPPPPTTVDEGDFEETESGLKIAVLAPGDGPRPEPGQTVVVNYTGWFTDGVRFDSSSGREPFEFVVGAGQVIPGWDEGLLLVEQGSTVQLVIPGSLAYGPTGSGPIPPNATLIFEVELLEIRDSN